MFTTQCLLFYGVIYWCCLQVYFCSLQEHFTWNLKSARVRKYLATICWCCIWQYMSAGAHKNWVLSIVSTVSTVSMDTCIALGVGLVPARSLRTGKSLCLVSTIQLLDMAAEFMELFHDSQGLSLTCTSKEAVELYNYVLENFVSTNNEYMSKLELALQLDSRFVMAQCFMVSLFLVTCWNRTLAQRARGTA